MNPVPDPSMAVGFLDLGLYTPGGLEIPAGLLGFQDCKWMFGSLPSITGKIAFDTKKLILYDQQGIEIPETDFTSQNFSFIAFGQ
jgi:hypothetical protein